ncbi:MAG: ABC transporter ATP-binding protein [Muribaculaceae bacterium]|nr:ABC transporter ATP-binding protein [Muribaculaceae bacterium]
MKDLEQPVISVKNLTQRYGTGRVIYQDLSFDVPRGRILGLLGKNGTGKTTTINILMGYLRPQSGECRIFGEDITTMSPMTRERIALLIEGHVQYAFMTIEQIEKFYSKFYKRWNRDAYYELMRKLHVSPRQHISTMSCGQRSQVALGLILAQNADLLVLDDFSLGLDPGYRRLFIEYLHEFAKAEEKTVFMTSHIIQDMERLIDDCIMLDYGKILTQMPVKELMDTFGRYTFTVDTDAPLPADKDFINPERIKNQVEIYSFKDADYVQKRLVESGIQPKDFTKQPMNLEDAFIGLTGKY